MRVVTQAVHPDRQADAIRQRFTTLVGAPFTLDGPAGETSALRAVCARPELRPLLDGIVLRVTRDMPVPFRVLDGRTIEIDADVVHRGPLTRLHVRHALEVAMWQRAGAGSQHGPAHKLSRAVLAAHCAIVYLQTMPRRDRDEALALAPAWLASLASNAIGASDDANARDAKLLAIAQHDKLLLALQSDVATPDALGPAVQQHAVALARGAIDVAIPVEHGLILGGDSRLLVDPDTRLNGYGCAPAPRPWAITFCSCTASSTSDLGFDEAERARQALLVRSFHDSALAPGFSTAMEQARGELRSFLGLDAVPGAEIVFCSSGTDCELFALYFSLATQPGRIVNVLVAPDEIGSGSSPAAKGWHFDRIAPLGRAVEPGATLLGVESDRVDVAALPLRDEDGVLIPLEHIDRELEALCSDARANDHGMLIHLLDSSKTGVRAPALSTVERLHAQAPNRRQVVVDAAQMRVDGEAIVGYLRRGFMVMISGSKFYTGTPFSGALLIPPGLARTIDDLHDLPPGFADYASRFELPPRWRRLRERLDARPNVGLLLRWQTALWEMRAYAAVPPRERALCFRLFERAFRKASAQYSYIDTLPAPVGDRNADGNDGRWDGIQTIFSFLVCREEQREGSASALTYDEGRRVYHWLNADISSALPDSATASERALAAKCCHIGQPVRIRRRTAGVLGALRIAVGARYISRVAFDPTLGRTRDDRIAAQVDDVHTVMRKIGVILKYWDSIAAHDTPQP